MKPTEKANDIEMLLELLSDNNRISSIKNNKCVGCGNKVTKFRNDISIKEYTISGLCQKCQDGVFGKN